MDGKLNEIFQPAGEAAVKFVCQLRNEINALQKTHSECVRQLIALKGQVALTFKRYNPCGWLAFIDGVDNRNLTGWVRRVDSDEPQFITCSLNGSVIYESFIADINRPDVFKAGFGNGRCGFSLKLDPAVCDAGLTLCCLSDPESGAVLAFKIIYIN